MYLALARWQWWPDRAPAQWDGPPGTVSRLDLRTKAQIGAGTGVGLFGFETDPSGRPDILAVIGDDPAGIVGAGRRTALANRLGVTFAATRLQDIFHEYLCQHADPAGLARVKPIVPQDDLRLRLVETGMGIDLSVPFDVDDPEFAPNVLAMLREDYRRVRAACVAGELPATLHRKVLGYWCRKYRTSRYEAFQPADLTVEEPLQPATTFTDTFNRADANPISSGTGQSSVATYTEFGAFGRTPDWAIVSNEARAQSDAGGLARADFDLSGPDQYAQAKLVNAVAFNTDNRVRGVAARIVAGPDFYGADCVEMFTTSDTWRSFYSDNGGFTAIGTNTSLNAVDGDILKLECNGSTITRYRNGSSQNAATNTSLSTGTRCGLVEFASGSTGATALRLDDFEAADLGGATYSDAYSEILTADASFSNTLTAVTTVSESVSLADALASIMTMPNALTESVTAGFAVSDGNIFSDTLTETVTVAQTFSVTMVHANTISEAVALAEMFATIGTFVNTLTEAVSLADAMAAGGGASSIWTVVSPDATTWTAVVPGNAVWTPQ